MGICNLYINSMGICNAYINSMGMVGGRDEFGKHWAKSNIVMVLKFTLKIYSHSTTVLLRMSGDFSFSIQIKTRFTTSTELNLNIVLVDVIIAEVGAIYTYKIYLNLNYNYSSVFIKFQHIRHSWNIYTMYIYISLYTFLFFC